MYAELISPDDECRQPVRDQVQRLLAACEPHAAALGCEAELEPVTAMAETTGAYRQLDLARGSNRLRGLVAALAGAFVAEGYPGLDESSDSLAPAPPARGG